MRTGIGVDVHRFGDSTGSMLWLGGIAWPGETALEGHSDSDVVVHAICDAMLSASQQGDLGSVFGTDRPEWKDASGATLLSEVLRIVRSSGFEIENVSVQIIGNKPKVGTRRNEMETALSSVLGAQVSVAATTTDGLGLTGRGEGLAAIATALLR